LLLTSGVATGEETNVAAALVHSDRPSAGAADNSIDMVTWILGPHELGFVPDGASLGDPAGAFCEITRVLKPGGVLSASDHITANSASLEAGGTLHRIEESVVTRVT